MVAQNACATRGATSLHIDDADPCRRLDFNAKIVSVQVMHPGEMVEKERNTETETERN